MQTACPSCSTALSRQSRFCSRCGRAVADSNIRTATVHTPLLERWRRLSHTLTRKEVRKLIGEPLQIDLDPLFNSCFDHKERWIYEYHPADRPEPRIRGEITFGISQGHVVHWSEPDWARLASA